MTPLIWRSLALLVLAPVACSPDVAVLAIDLDELPPDIDRLEVRIALAADTTERPPRSLGQSRGFDVQLPANALGPVHLQIDGRSATGCINGHLEHDVTITGPARYPLRLHLDPRPGCQLRVDRVGTGQGRVTVAPQNLTCQDWQTPCMARFPERDRTVMLTAQALGPESYFLGWTAACHGTGSCTLPVDSAASQVGAMFLPKQVCGVEGWCWQRPRPTGEYIYRIWGAAADDLWALGDNGLMLRGDGRVFAPLPRMTRVGLQDVRGSGPNDVWAVGLKGAALRWRGKAWETVDSGTDLALSSVWSFAPDHAYAVGEKGLILRWDGARWQAKTSASSDTLTAIWGARRQDGSIDLWMVGDNGVVVRGDGERFQVIDRIGQIRFSDLWGYNPTGRTEPEMVWVVGAGCTAVRYPDRRRLQGSATCVLRAVWGSGPESIWFGGTGGQIFRFRDNALAKVYTSQQSATPMGEEFYSIWGSGPEDVWFAGSMGTIDHHNGISITPLGSAPGPTLRSVFAIAPDDVWAIGDEATLHHWRDGVWVPTPLNVAGRTLVYLYGVWASGPKDVWLVGQTTAGSVVLRSDGQSGDVMEVTDDGEVYTKVWGSGPDDVWVGGSLARFVHFTPGKVQHYTTNNVTRDWVVSGIAGSSAREVLFTGIVYGLDASGNRIIEKTFGALFDGSSLKPVAAPPGGATLHLAYHPLTSYVAAGVGYVMENGSLRERPFAARFSGSVGAGGAWTTEPVEGTVNPLYGVFGTNLSDLRAVGAGGVMVARGEDGRWRAMERMASATLYAIHGLPNGEAWAVGWSGSVLHRPPR